LVALEAFCSFLRRRILVRKLLLAGFVVTLGGCTTPTIYSKSITITQDASGKVVETVIIESVQQPNRRGNLFRFDHLRGVDPE